MRHLLHDEVDESEQLRNQAKDIVADLIGEVSVAKAIDVAGGDIENMLSLLAMAVEEELAAHTTKAFKSGVAAAVKRGQG